MAERDFPRAASEPEADEEVVRLLRVIETEGTISWQEIEDVLVDGGYSADGRKNLLAEILTRLAQTESGQQSPEAGRLAEKVKGVLEEYQSGRPAATDLL